MTVPSDHSPRIAGYIKFDASVSADMLFDIARGLNRTYSERLVDLHVRGDTSGSDVHIIAFVLTVPDDTHKIRKKDVNKIIQYLIRKLGIRPGDENKERPVPQGVICWNITRVKFMI